MAVNEISPADVSGDAAAKAPSVIAEDVNVKYRVIGGRKRDFSPEMGRIRSLLNRSRSHVGAVSEIHAVKGVSFTAYHGESIGLVGLNGAGKSTLLRAVAGLMPLSSGAVYTSSTPALLGVNAALIKSLSGRQNVMIGGLALGLTRRQVEEKFDEIVDFAGVGDFIDLPMKAYSSGMAARLRFAISTVAIPEILMIDEALATGDAAFKRRSRERIAEVKDGAGTVFIVSHTTKTIKRLCDRVIWIHQGELVDDGPTDEVLPRYKEALNS